jgi:hypothetical protein
MHLHGVGLVYRSDQECSRHRATWHSPRGLNSIELKGIASHYPPSSLT